jgi:hypothetical protein
VQREHTPHLPRTAFSSRSLCDANMFEHHVAEMRALMARESIQTCALSDDQWAVMPRHLADDYFLLEDNYPHAPPTDRLRAAAQPERPHAHHTAARATYGKSAHAPSPSPDAYARICAATGPSSPYTRDAYARRSTVRHPTLTVTPTLTQTPSQTPSQTLTHGPRNWSHLFTAYLGGGYAVGRAHPDMHARKAGLEVGGASFFSKACCEWRMTWRLMGRLVPTKVVPFPFAGPTTNGPVGMGCSIR